MNLLNSLFSLLHPNKPNWLSKKYFRWTDRKHRKENALHREYLKDKTISFDIPGAGDLLISKSCHHSTGEVVGFSLGVEWGRHGFSGGVIGRDEAKRLAEFILKKCTECTETMEEERQRKNKELFEYYNNKD